jgi:hypothetical protein
VGIGLSTGALEEPEGRTGSPPLAEAVEAAVACAGDGAAVPGAFADGAVVPTLADNAAATNAPRAETTIKRIRPATT